MRAWVARCGCEMGWDCTKTTMCALESAVEEMRENLVRVHVERLVEEGFILPEDFDDAMEALYD